MNDEFSVTFEIDDGELDSASKQECFVLGFEFCDFYNLLESGSEFEKMIHSDNLDRLLHLCSKAGRICTMYMHDDWPTLLVRGA